MITYRTIFSLLLALLFTGGIFAWHLQSRDDCDRYAHGDPKATQEVQYGSSTVNTPCQIWVARQPLPVQSFALVDLAIIVVFIVSFGYDITNETRRRASFRR